jgi:RNA polymerase-binding transcription factor DksA
MHFRLFMTQVGVKFRVMYKVHTLGYCEVFTENIEVARLTARPGRARYTCG